MASKTSARPFTRSGLHRLECDCGAYAYARVAQLEAHGIPSCPRCLVPFDPERLELAILLGVDNGRSDEIERLALDKRMSQERSLGRRRLEIKWAAGTLNDMAAAALEEIREIEREAARGRRLAAFGLGERVEKVRGEEIRTRFVLPTPEPLPF